MKEISDKIIRYRYIIAVVAFFLGVVLNLNGSSLSIWDDFGISETRSGQQISSTSDPSILYGHAELIRSDEYMVQLPYFLSQVETGAKLNSDLFGLSSMNMIVAYNAPVRHISIIGKPFNWGALFLDASHALSWYWCFKVITFLLLAFELSMILTKGNKLLSAASSFFITYIPAVQWWFMQHLGDVVWYSLFAMVMIHHFFKSDTVKKKLIFATGLIISLVGFVLVIYPAFQVPFAYLIFIFFLLYFIDAIRSNKLKLEDWLIMLATIIVTTGVLAYTIRDSWDAIMATINTAYPGHRVSTGGEYSWRDLTSMFVNPFLPYKLTPFSNQVELSSSINSLLLITVLIPVTIPKRKIFENKLGILLTLISLALMAYAIIGVPEIISKATLFSYVTSSRAWQASSVTAVLATIWYISYLWKEKNTVTNWKVWTLSGLVLAFYSFLIISDTIYRTYVGRMWQLIILLVIALLWISVLRKWRIVTVFILVMLATVSGFNVNPIVQGISSVEDKAISREISSIVSQDRDARWLVESSQRLYNFPQIFGAKSVNGVRFYPDTKLMEILDSTGEQKDVWNRYAHTKITLIDTDTTLSAEESPDILNISLNYQELQRIGIDYIITSRDLNQMFGERFVLVYGPDLDGNRIYHFSN